MATVLLVGYLAVHGLLHLAIWLPHPEDPTKPPPFRPDHSALLTAAAVPASTTHGLSVVLAVATAAAYVIAALAVAAGTGAVATVVVAALLGLALKVGYFHPWLLLGLALDALALTSALTGWPVTLS